MLRRIVCVTNRRSAAVVVTFIGCRRLATQDGVMRAAFLLHSAVPITFLTSRRTAATQSTTAGRNHNGAASGVGLTDAEIIAIADWKSPQYEERLGLGGGDAITEERLKRHYYVLAKHFHPDSAAGAKDRSDGGGAQAAEAFHNVKEAYDAISATLKDSGSDRSGSPCGNRSESKSGYSNEFAGGFTYSDEARRRSQMRLLGETVVLFVAMTVLLIYIVSRHNKSRMQSRYLWHLVWIFFMIQLFPRLLASAILFAAHSMYLLDNTTLREQAAVSLIVKRSKSEYTVKLDGIRAESTPHVVVQVTTTTTPAKSDDHPAGSAAVKASEVSELASTLTFDRGVTEFILPTPATAHAIYHIKAVDEERRMILVDRTITALA